MATQAVRIALTFAVVGAIWILASDALLFGLVSDYAGRRLFEIAKGLLFVGLSSLLIWWLIARWERRERDRAEERRRLRDTYRRVLDSLDEAVFVVRGSRIEDCNAAAERMFGYSRSELLGESTAILHPDRRRFDGLRQGSRDVLGRGEVFQERATMRRRDGSTFPASHTVTPLEADSDPEPAVVSVVRDETLRVEAEVRRREFFDHLQEVREVERARIAREIHDDLGQALTGIRIDLTRIRDGVEDPAALDILDGTLELVDGTVRSVRTLATELRPGVLDELGLVPTLAWMAEQHDGRFPEGCTFVSDVEDVDLPDRAQVHLFRIAQEAITNALRHSGASSARIRIEELDGRVVVEVEDDGRWTEPGRDTTTFGLTGMHERARLIGGSVTIDPGETGTRVRVVAPADPRASGTDDPSGNPYPRVSDRTRRADETERP